MCVRKSYKLFIFTAMEFGKAEKETLDTIDFTLPPDGKFTQALKKTKKPPKIYVGCAKWGRPEWLGLIYPEKTREKEFLDHYVKSFNGIEVNATYYQVYPPETIAKWAQKAEGRDFKFCPKISNVISHYGDLGSHKAQLDTDRYLRGILAFGKHLGPVFLQLGDRFGPQRKAALFSYLEKWPDDLPFTVEVRHQAWFEEPLKTELFDLLHKLRLGAVITDVSDRRDCLHMEITSPYVMIRFVGNGKHPTDYTRIDDWVQRIKSWMQKDIREIHFYMHQPDETYTPEMVSYVIDRLNAECGLKLEKPHFLGGEQGELF